MALQSPQLCCIHTKSTINQTDIHIVLAKCVPPSLSPAQLFHIEFVRALSTCLGAARRAASNFNIALGRLSFFPTLRMPGP